MYGLSPVLMALGLVTAASAFGVSNHKCPFTRSTTRKLQGRAPHDIFIFREYNKMLVTHGGLARAQFLRARAPRRESVAAVYTGTRVIDLDHTIVVVSAVWLRTVRITPAGSQSTASHSHKLAPRPGSKFCARARTPSSYIIATQRRVLVPNGVVTKLAGNDCEEFETSDYCTAAGGYGKGAPLSHTWIVNSPGQGLSSSCRACLWCPSRAIAFRLEIDVGHLGPERERAGREPCESMLRLWGRHTARPCPL